MGLSGTALGIIALVVIVAILIGILKIEDPSKRYEEDDWR